MAAPLIALFLPPVVETFAGLTMGAMNAAQAEHSGWTLSIGNKVFSTTKPFPFGDLPFELREQIILYALELSQSLLRPAPVIPTDHPFHDPSALDYAHPFNPHHPDFVNGADERVRGAHPASAWRWARVGREWAAILRPRLWARVILHGRPQWKGFLRLLEQPDNARGIKGFVKTLVLGHGWEESFELYTVIQALPGIDELVYAPTPPKKHIRAFGLNLIPTTPGPSSISIPELPFDRITNASTRAHLARLPRLCKLELALSALTLELGAFLAGLPHLTTLVLRLPSLHPSQLAPFQTPDAELHGASDPDSDSPPDVDAKTRIRPGAATPAGPRAPLVSLELHARMIHADTVPQLRALLASDARLGAITSVFRLPPPAPLALAFQPGMGMGMAGGGGHVGLGLGPGVGPGVPVGLAGGGGTTVPRGGAEEQQSLLVYAPVERQAAALARAEGPTGVAAKRDEWTRLPHGVVRVERGARATTTNVRVLGGLINLRMEAHK